MSTNTTHGRCLCQAVMFAFNGAPKWTLHCHCESCRRATSAPIATWISVPQEAFQFTQGTPSYYNSSPGVRRGFCSRCGSPLTYENERLPGEIHVLACALSDPTRVEPSAHVFAGEQLPWFESADPLPRYQKTRRNASPIRHGTRR